MLNTINFIKRKIILKEKVIGTINNFEKVNNKNTIMQERRNLLVYKNHRINEINL